MKAEWSGQVDKSREPFQVELIAGVLGWHSEQSEFWEPYVGQLHQNGKGKVRSDRRAAANSGPLCPMGAVTH